MPILIGGVAGCGVLVAVFLAVLGAVFPDPPADTACLAAPGKTARAQIPPVYLTLYDKAGVASRVGWAVLAAVGAIESDHGRGPGPGIRSGSNDVGAAGPMQFMPGTWAAFGLDGNHDGKKNVYDPADAIPAAARYLAHNGAPADLRKALYVYNHSWAYVDTVLAKAAAYTRDAPAPTCDPAALTQAAAQVPAYASARAALALRAALRQIGTPYSWGGGSLTGPSEGFGRGAGIVGFDCSSLTRYAWHQAGISIPRTSQDQWRTLPHVPAGQVQPGDLVFFQGSFGSASAPGHVGLVLDRDRFIEAPRTGLKVRVASLRTRRDLIGYARPTPRTR